MKSKKQFVLDVAICVTVGSILLGCFIVVARAVVVFCTPPL